MKKIFLLLGVVFITSCGYDTPVLSDPQDPFIVHTIESHKNNPNLSLYYSEPGGATAGMNISSIRACIVLEKGLYNIGDTIYIGTKK